MEAKDRNKAATRAASAATRWWLAAAAGGVALGAWYYVKSERELAALREQIARLEAREERRPASAAPVSTAAPAPSAVTTSTSSASAPKAATGAAASTAKALPANALTPEQFLAETYAPEKLQSLRSGSRLKFERQFAPAFKAAGVTPDEAEKIMRKFIEHDLLPVELMKALSENGGVTRGSFESLLKQQQQAIETEIAGILGDRRERFTDARRVAAARESLEPLINRLTYSAHPLTGQQIARLMELLVAETGRRPSLFATSVAWPERFVREAQQTLGPEQQAALGGVAKDRVAAQAPVLPARGVVPAKAPTK